MPRRVSVARGIGIQRADPMYQPGAHQKIEGAIHRDRCRFVAMNLQLVEQIVGADRSVMPTDQLIDITTQWSKGKPTFPTQSIRGTHQLGELRRVRCFFGEPRQLHLLDQGAGPSEGIMNASLSVESDGIVDP